MSFFFLIHQSLSFLKWNFPLCPRKSRTLSKDATCNLWCQSTTNRRQVKFLLLNGILFAVFVQEEGVSITVNSVHPGLIMTPLMRHNPLLMSMLMLHSIQFLPNTRAIILHVRHTKRYRPQCIKLIYLSYKTCYCFTYIIWWYFFCRGF